MVSGLSKQLEVEMTPKSLGFFRRLRIELATLQLNLSGGHVRSHNLVQISRYQTRKILVSSITK